jgi:hypothetical protein
MLCDFGDQALRDWQLECSPCLGPWGHCALNLSLAKQRVRDCAGKARHSSHLDPPSARDIT